MGPLLPAGAELMGTGERVAKKENNEKRDLLAFADQIR